MKIVFNYSGRYQATPEIKCVGAIEQHTKSRQRSFMLFSFQYNLFQHILCLIQIYLSKAQYRLYLVLYYN